MTDERQWSAADEIKGVASLIAHRSRRCARFAHRTYFSQLGERACPMRQNRSVTGTGEIGWPVHFDCKRNPFFFGGAALCRVLAAKLVCQALDGCRGERHLWRREWSARANSNAQV